MHAFTFALTLSMPNLPLLFFCPCLCFQDFTFQFKWGQVRMSGVLKNSVMPNEAKCVFLFLHPPPSVFSFSVICLRVIERVLLKMLSSNFIYLFTAPQQKLFVY